MGVSACGGSVKVLLHYTDNWKSIADVVVPIAQAYCDRHRYELCVNEVEPYEKYNGLWKMWQMQTCLNLGDIALILDADTLITNFNIKVEDFLDEEKDLYLSEGLNMGVFIIRSTTWSRNLIEGFIDRITNGFFHCEQDAIETHIKAFPEDGHIKICKHPCFNSFIPELYGHIENPAEITEEKGRWVEGKSFILHVPSLGMDQRLEVLKNAKITR